MKFFLSYFQRHWRGEPTIARRFFLGLLTYHAGGAFATLPIQFFISRRQWDGLFLPFFIYEWLVHAALAAWFFTGVWRAAERAGEKAKGAGVAQVFVCLQVTGFAISSIAVWRWQIQDAINFPALLRRVDAYEVRLRKDATELVLVGGVGRGLAGRVKSLFEQNPGIKTVHLNLYKGGRLDEARKLKDLFREKGVTTMVEGACVSACPLAFLGGKERLITPGARLGFHTPMVPGSRPPLDIFLQLSWERDLRAAGVSQGFAFKVSQTPPKAMWYPDETELLEGGILTRPVESPRDPFSEDFIELVSLGQPIKADAAMMQEELLKLDLFQSLQRALPREFARMVDLALLFTAIGQPIEEISSKLTGDLAEAFQEALPYASDEALIQVARSRAHLYSAIMRRSIKDCSTILRGSDAARSGSFWNTLPAEVNKEQEKAMTEVFRSMDRKRSPARPGDIRSDLKAALDRANRRAEKSTPSTLAESYNDAKACNAEIFFYEEIAALPVVTAGGILRAVFSRR
jgi:hypothetical protein